MLNVYIFRKVYIIIVKIQHCRKLLLLCIVTSFEPSIVCEIQTEIHLA